VVPIRNGKRDLAEQAMREHGLRVVLLQLAHAGALEVEA
jgi:hypothetical protein